VCVCVGKKEEKKKQTSIHERRTNDDHFCLFLARARALPLYFASAGKFFPIFTLTLLFCICWLLLTCFSTKIISYFQSWGVGK
jgi:hypothetical protein